MMLSQSKMSQRMMPYSIECPGRLTNGLSENTDALTAALILSLVTSSLVQTLRFADAATALARTMQVMQCVVVP